MATERFNTRRRTFILWNKRSEGSWNYESDWRNNLFTIFVERLSKRVSRKALWELFELFKRVVDVFIPRGMRNPISSTTFAFIRYRMEIEMFNVIRIWNNRRIDGWVVSVKKVDYGWKERKMVSSVNESYDMKKVKENHRWKETLRDDRSYKQVVVDREESLVCKGKMVERVKNQWMFGFLCKKLHCMSGIYFKTLGDKWGKFIRLDYDTIEKKRFDVARILVSDDSIMKIQSVVTVKQNLGEFKTLVSLDDDLEIKEEQDELPLSGAAMADDERRMKEDVQAGIGGCDFLCWVDGSNPPEVGISSENEELGFENKLLAENKELRVEIPC
ncbi:hypothetical protein PTKIN_Ptkin18bG0127900 [Pterospermum kingtungense]